MATYTRFICMKIVESLPQPDSNKLTSAETWACCTRCGHEVSVSGVGEFAHMNCAALMREQCPRREDNEYILGDSTWH